MFSRPASANKETPPQDETKPKPLSCRRHMPALLSLMGSVEPKTNVQNMRIVRVEDSRHRGYTLTNACQEKRQSPLSHWCRRTDQNVEATFAEGALAERTLAHINTVHSQNVHSHKVHFEVHPISHPLNKGTEKATRHPPPTHICLAEDNPDYAPSPRLCSLLLSSGCVIDGRRTTAVRQTISRYHNTPRRQATK